MSSHDEESRLWNDPPLSQDEVERLLCLMSDTPKRETSEMTDLNEIEWLLATQRRNDEEIAQKKESLRARLNLLEEAVAGVRSEEKGEVERLKKENAALRMTVVQFGKSTVVPVFIFCIMLAVVAFVFGQYTATWRHQRQTPPPVTVQPETETLESFVARESQSLSAAERQKLIAVAETILNVHFDTPAEIREAFRYERRKTGIDSPAFDAFVEKWTEKVESMNVEENVDAVRQVYESLLSGLRSFNDISGVPVEGFFSIASPSNVTPTHNGDVPVSSDVLPVLPTEDHKISTNPIVDHETALREPQIIETQQRRAFLRR